MKFSIITLLMLLLNTAFAVTVLGNPHQVYFGDPFIFLDANTYYMYGTSSDDGIEVYKSADLVHWEGPCGAGDGLALHKADVYGEKWFWAPEVYKEGNKYYMFFSAEEHIAVAVSDSPLGPFVQEKQVPLFETKAIDTHLFIDEDGKKYLYYVAFANGNVIRMCEMNDDLLSVKANTVKECFGRSQLWEFSKKEPVGVVNEGPFILKKGKTYYMVYSANHYASPDYGIGYATASSPYGPWTKYGGNPVWQSPDTIRGVGHCSFFKDKNGVLQMVYHSHFNQKKVHPRRTFINQASFVREKGSRLPVLKVLDEQIVPLTNAYFTNPLFNGADPWVMAAPFWYSFSCRSARTKIIG